MKIRVNLYENIYLLENIQEAFDEVCAKIEIKHIKEYISRIYEVLKTENMK